MRRTFRLILVFLVVLGVWLYIADRDAYRRHEKVPATAAEKEAATLAAARELEAKAKRNLVEHADGGHCLDRQTGTHPGVVGWVRAHLADPASFQAIATEMTPANNHGQHLLKLTYRARRADGGDYQTSETFVVENSDCSFER